MARAAPAPRTLLDREEPAIGQAYQRFDPRIGGPVSHQCRKDFLPRPERGVEPDDRIAILITRPHNAAARIDRERFEVAPILVGSLIAFEGAEHAGPPPVVGAVELEPAPGIGACEETATGKRHQSGEPTEPQRVAAQFPAFDQREGAARDAPCFYRRQPRLGLQRARRRRRAQPGARCERANERGGKKKALGAHGPYLQSVGGDEPVSPSDRRRGAGRAANCAI